VFSLVSSDVAGQPILLTTGDDGTFSILLRPGRYTVRLDTRSMNLEFAPTVVTVTPTGVRDIVLHVGALRPVVGPGPRGREPVR
jgi:hypothetical protein